MSDSEVGTAIGPETKGGSTPFAVEAAEVAAGLGSDLSTGLTTSEASSRLSRYGPNKITGEKPPSVIKIALTQLRDPMNIMLIAVTVVSFAIGQVSTGVIVALLILLNVVLGSRQELKARASVDALSNLQVPQAKVVRERRFGARARRRCRARRPGPGRGGRHRAGGRTDRPVRDAGGPGGGAHRRERAGQQGQSDSSDGQGPARRPVQHAVPEHLGHPRHRVDGRHRHRDEHPDGSDRHDADLGHPDPVAAAEGTGHADQGARDRRLDRRGVHRRGGAHPRRAGQRSPVVGHGDGDLRNPDRSARVRVRDALLRRKATRRGQGRGEEPHRRGDPRLDERDQYGQDRHPDHEPDDGVDAVRERVLVHRGGRGLPQARGDPVRRRGARPGLRPAGAGPGTGHRRHGGRRRSRGRRPDGGGAGRAGRQTRGGRGGDPPGLPATGRGAVRLRVQVHGHLPPLVAGRNRVSDRAGQGCTRCRARPMQPLRRAAQRQPGADRTRRGTASRRPTRGWARRGCASWRSRSG